MVQSGPSATPMDVPRGAGTEMDRIARIESMLTARTAPVAPIQAAPSRDIILNANSNSWLTNIEESLYSFQSIVDENFNPLHNPQSNHLDLSFLNSVDPTAASNHAPSCLFDPMSVDNTMKSPSLSGSVSSSSAVAVTAPRPTLTELEIHLIDLFFTFLHAGTQAVFHEHLFYGNLFPVNFHPTYLTDIICATAALFSTHPDVMLQGGRSRLSMSFYERSKEALAASMTRQIEHDSAASVAAVQTMALQSFLEFGINQAPRAHRTINVAIQMAVRLKLDREDTYAHLNPLSIFLGVPGVLSPAQIEERRRVWAACLLVDTIAGTVSGFFLTIDESNSSFLLAPPKPISRPEVREDETQAEKRERGAARYMRCVTNPTRQTIFHACFPAIPEPKVVIYNEEDQLVVNQTCFLIRRILRLNYSFRMFPVGEKHHTDRRAQIVKETLNSPPDGKILHDALMDWYAALPDRFRAFESIADFMPNSNAVDPTRFTLRSGFDPQLPAAVQVVSLFLMSLCTLHLPYADDQRAVFKACGGEVANWASLHRLTRFDVVLLARRAQNHFIKSLMPGLGLNANRELFETDSDEDGGKHRDPQDDIERADVPGPHPAQNYRSKFDTRAREMVGGPGKEGCRDPPHDESCTPMATSPEMGRAGCSIGAAGMSNSLSALLRSPTTTELSPSNPPPPHSLCCTPTLSFTIFTLAAAALAVSGFTSDRSGKEAVDIENGVMATSLPAIDRLGLMWPVATRYAARLRKVMKAVHSRWEKEKAEHGGLQA
ncbi:hypothetical protein HK101_011021 [Irineochytrium annulatum]|nr:hypothetical protein HK101_011021 [Irineochytrium annulatum]